VSTIHIADGNAYFATNDWIPRPARWYAEQFLRYLQRPEYARLHGIFVWVGELELTLYPAFLRAAKLPARPWHSVAMELKKMVPKRRETFPEETPRIDMEFRRATIVRYQIPAPGKTKAPRMRLVKGGK